MTASGRSVAGSKKQRTDESRTRRNEVLTSLRARQEPASITTLAAELGVHPNTVRFHLDALTATGQVEQVTVPRSGPGRPALMFQAHRGMDPAGPRNYQLLAEVLVADIGADPEPSRRAAQAGAAWGSKLGRSRAVKAEEAGDVGGGVGQLVDLLGELGFAPELSAAGDQVGLHHCPFLELATDRSGVVCPLHLGIVRGAMAELDPSVSVDGLDPFVEPDLCRVRLSRAGGTLS
ncbi:transcriptional regulator [Kineosporia sp. NBRC 101677]|uniref:helix-turn-helix transcriptional regulator n=1 Tax=Kineosporia sp. NBRC 101677 TaxID=3032197 RepID=UPI0024A414E9|nr:helix-turn-helix domain-containing protein [Kineosporia sp. NBRC 101677]GLY19539.1 transcriptional regulator [Kineosporia sp. NBRC 101677]